jgi:hypothetical protein
MEMGRKGVRHILRTIVNKNAIQTTSQPLFPPPRTKYTHKICRLIIKNKVKKRKKMETI